MVGKLSNEMPLYGDLPVGKLERLSAASPEIMAIKTAGAYSDEEIAANMTESRTILGGVNCHCLVPWLCKDLKLVLGIVLSLVDCLGGRGGEGGAICLSARSRAAGSATADNDKLRPGLIGRGGAGECSSGVAN